VALVWYMALRMIVVSTNCAEKELLILTAPMSSPLVFSGGACWSIFSFLYRKCFLDHWLFLCPFSFGHCIICPSIYDSWLSLWYLKTFLADHCLSFCPFPFSIVLSVLRFTASINSLVS
jgi:hypothetical protein